MLTTLFAAALTGTLCMQDCALTADAVATIHPVDGVAAGQLRLDDRMTFELALTTTDDGRWTLDLEHEAAVGIATCAPNGPDATRGLSCEGTWIESDGSAAPFELTLFFASTL